MKIFKEGNKIRFQLIERTAYGTRWLFDFTIPEEAYDELKQHMIEALEQFSP